MLRENDSVNILGIPVSRISSEEALGLMMQWALAEEPHHIVTVNPEYVMIAQHNDAFCRVLQRSSLQLADGMGILWAARLLGRPIKERLTGVDTVRAFARRAAGKGIKLFLLGAAPGVAEKAAEVLVRENDGLLVVGTYAGSPSPAEEQEICERIRSVRPHVLLVAYGAPNQDLWIARTREELRVPLAIGIGGTLDFIAGTRTRAPLWMQRWGVEWLFRLVQEPTRWKRMMRLPHFAWLVLLAAARRLFTGTSDVKTP